MFKHQHILDQCAVLQNMATAYGIEDVFSDSNGKLLQVLSVTNLQILPGRNGNDAIDPEGNEYEIKTTTGKSFSTNHHINPTILSKYRQTRWLFALCGGILLQELYLLSGEQLEPYFTKWERKWHEDGKDLNNPKIPLLFVKKHGKQIYHKGD